MFVAFIFMQAACIKARGGGVTLEATVAAMGMARRRRGQKGYAVEGAGFFTVRFGKRLIASPCQETSWVRRRVGRAEPRRKPALPATSTDSFPSLRPRKGKTEMEWEKKGGGGGWEGRKGNRKGLRAVS